MPPLLLTALPTFGCSMQPGQSAPLRGIGLCRFLPNQPFPSFSPKQTHPDTQTTHTKTTDKTATETETETHTHTQSLTQVRRRPAVRRKPLNTGAGPGCPFPCRRPSVGNRRLYTLAAPAADPFGRPRPNPVDRCKTCCVGYACRADRINRHFVGVGRAPTSMAENVLQDDLIEAPQDDPT